MKRICLKLLVILAVNSTVVVGQSFEEERVRDLDLERIVRLAERMRGTPEPTTEGENPGKCGLRISFEIMKHWKDFSELQKQRLAQLFAQPERQKRRTIGRFTIFYDTIGTNAPALIIPARTPCQRIAGTVEAYIDSVGKFFNAVWNYETDSLGYAAPPVQDDNTYWIDVHELNAGLYGQTFFGPSNSFDPDPIDPGPPPRFRTYVEVDNDYCTGENYYSRGMAGLKVTAAHEFHHAIQLGSYGYLPGDLYFYEITSTWMEDVVYSDVNDYYQYLVNAPCGYPCSQFSTPDVHFTEYNGSIEYSRSIWGKFIEKRYSRDIMRYTWEGMRQSMTSIPAIDGALEGIGSSFRQAFLEWAWWNLNTGLTADTIKYYTEGRKYPSMDTTVVNYTPPQRIINDSIQG
ncbi:MAG TPA: MXAN_6640 family putative metalloprotease, partial [Bacteroidota bacterium]|nr:MXAN_6640 family putative metalloprotease [Bacteroidota bacterium]